MSEVTSKPSSEAYRDGWERVFGNKRPPEWEKYANDAKAAGMFYSGRDLEDMLRRLKALYRIPEPPNT